MGGISRISPPRARRQQRRTISCSRKLTSSPFQKPQTSCSNPSHRRQRFGQQRTSSTKSSSQLSQDEPLPKNVGKWRLKPFQSGFYRLSPII